MRMAEYAFEQDDRDLEDAAYHQYEQELLQRDPAFAAWLDQLNAETQQEPDMKIGTMLDSKYLKKEDVDPPRMLTIVGFDKVNVP